MAGRVKYIYAFIMVAVLACCGGEAFGQHYFGVRGGIGSGTGSRFYPKRAESASMWGLYHGGVSWKYYTSQKYVGGTQVDLLYMQQGFKEVSDLYATDKNPGDTTAYYSRKVNSIVMPLFWQPHVYLFNRNMRVFLNAGVMFSYNISSTYEQGSGLEGIPVDKGKYEMDIVKDNRWGYGLVAGGGIGYSVGRVEVLAEVRYYIGYSDIKKNWNKYWDEEYVHRRLRTPLDGLQGSVGVYYRFGKKGILSPPSPKVEQRMREIEEKRLRRRGLWVEPSEEYGITDDGTEVEEGYESTEENRDNPGEMTPERNDIPQPVPEEFPSTEPDGVLSVFIR